MGAFLVVGLEDGARRRTGGARCIGLTLIFVGAGLDAILNGDHSASISLVAHRRCVVFVTSAASAAFFTGGVRLKRLNVQFRSPIVLTRTQSPASRRIQVQSPVAAAPAPPPRPANRGRENTRGSRCRALVTPSVAHRSSDSGASNDQGSLADLVIAGGRCDRSSRVRPTSSTPSYLDSFWLMILAAIGFLVAGVSVFGLENRARTYRFLVHHGARPGLVWVVKLATWIFGLAMIAWWSAALGS